MGPGFVTTFLRFIQTVNYFSFNFREFKLMYGTKNTEKLIQTTTKKQQQKSYYIIHIISKRNVNRKSNFPFVLYFPSRFEIFLQQKVCNNFQAFNTAASPQQWSPWRSAGSCAGSAFPRTPRYSRPQTAVARICRNGSRSGASPSSSSRPRRCL